MPPSPPEMASTKPHPMLVFAHGQDSESRGPNNRRPMPPGFSGNLTKPAMTRSITTISSRSIQI
jgi:hypothetical protein